MIEEPDLMPINLYFVVWLKPLKAGPQTSN